jgi:hypothetical protein
MYLELFHIGFLTIYSYGFFIIFGVLLAFLNLYKNKQEFGLSVDKISEFCLVYGQFVAILVVLTCSYFYVRLLRKSKTIIEK